MNNGAFGEGFPYTSFHELNMDWIIRIIKDFEDKYPDFVEELNKKLNKPTDNPSGTRGDILMSNGDGTTSWENVSISYAPIIIEAVNEWLTEHPEATTTVEDKAITLPKLADYVRYLVENNDSGFIAPVYMGDYIIGIDYLPSAVVRVGDHFVTVDAPTSSHAIATSSGVGYIKDFSLSNNSMLGNYEVLVGHGNSIAFDGLYYYVTPIWDYSSGAESTIRTIYKYDRSFNLVQEIGTPIVPNAVSFDPVTSTLYMKGNDSGMTYIYKITERTQEIGVYDFTLYASIDMPLDNETLSRTYNQDMAIYNNEFYISSAYGNIIHGLLTEGVLTVSNSFYMSGTDSTGRFRMGELEGMEFDADGHLYAIIYTTLGDTDCRNAFVTELPVNKIPQNSPTMSGQFGVNQGTLTLSEAIQNQFYLNTNQIRSINQLNVHAITNESSKITIPASNNIIDPWSIRINQSVQIELYGHYECKGFDILSGIVTFYGASANNQLTMTNNTKLIYVYRSAIVGFTGGNRIHFYTPNMTSNTTDNFIAKGSQYTMTYTRLAPDNMENKIMKVGSMILYDYDIQMGQSGILSIGSGYTAQHITGYISNNSTELKLYMTPPRFLHDTVELTGSVTIRTNKGYLNGSQANAVINLAGTDHNVSVRRYNDFNLEITITNTDNSQFTNIDNNTPIDAFGTITVK